MKSPRPFFQPPLPLSGKDEDAGIWCRAYSLIELLCVIAVLVTLGALVVPSVATLGKAQHLAKAAADIASTFQQARAYAMANNTYVYVGVFEADASLPETVRPQTAGLGRLYITAVASKDGSGGYTADNLTDISKTRHFSGIHLVEKSIATTLTGMDADTINNLDLSVDAVTTFSSPIGAANPLCTFAKVIQISPSGGANVITKATNTPTIAPYIQFGIQPAHGDTIASNTANCAGIQIDSITGVVRTFRPGQP